MANAERIRLLTAVPLCDGHDSAINTINLELVRHGVEVVYLGYHRPVADVVRAAIQEGVRGVGISSYNGGHAEYFGAVVDGLRDAGAGHVKVFGGGGGTITRDDEAEMTSRGVAKIFFAGTPLDEMTAWVKATFAEPSELSTTAPTHGDLAVSRLLDSQDAASEAVDRSPPLTIGFTGPGGAGKTTLIDELVLRTLKHTDRRVAILSHDPSTIGDGALLGDRATMIHSQSDRVFMRSLATRGRAGGLAPQSAMMLRKLKSLDFDLILVETVGVGQEAMPFGDAGEEVDVGVFVMSPEYGSRLQLQKIAMLDLADVVVVNKSDRAGATTAKNEVESRVRLNRDGRQRVMTTCAKRHRDAGVEALFSLLIDDGGPRRRNAAKRKQRAEKMDV